MTTLWSAYCDVHSTYRHTCSVRIRQHSIFYVCRYSRHVCDGADTAYASSSPDRVRRQLGLIREQTKCAAVNQSWKSVGPPTHFNTLASASCVAVYSAARPVGGIVRSCNCRCVFLDSILYGFVRRHRTLLRLYPLVTDIYTYRSSLYAQGVLMCNWYDVDTDTLIPNLAFPHEYRTGCRILLHGVLTMILCTCEHSSWYNIRSATSEIQKWTYVVWYKGCVYETKPFSISHFSQFCEKSKNEWVPKFTILIQASDFFCQYPMTVESQK
jgi:hypothetical protein